MRLIDADKENERLLDFIVQNDVGIQYALEHKDMTMLEDILFDYFVGQTIAYNMDKVVKKLEEKTEIAYKKYMNCPPNASQSVVAKYLTQYQEMASCLKIVKSGITK